MARIVVYSKDHLIHLQSTQNNKLSLNQNSMVLMPFSKENIASIERSGTTAIIHLKNGEQVVLENFFNVDGVPQHMIVMSNPEGYYEVAVLDQAGQLIQYNPVSNLNQLLGSPNWISDVQVNVIQDAATNQSAWYKGAWVKPALLAVGAEAIYLTAFKKDDDKPTAPKDIFPPSVPKGTLDSDGKVIVGQAEAGAKVFVIDSNFNVLAETTAGSDGSYTLNLKRAMTDGERAYVYAQDKAGNKSNYLSVTGTKDTIAPEVIEAQFSPDGKSVSGKTEAKAKVYLYSEDGETILVGPITAANDGGFTLTLSSSLPTGTKAKVVAVDEAGNKSILYEVIVGQDTVAPSKPTLEVSSDGITIVGKGEAKAVVQILDENNNVIEEQIIDDNGRFEIILSPALSSDSNYKLVVKDASNNQSKSIDLKPGLDTLAPEKVSATLNDDGMKVTGIAEANSTIEIRSGNNVIGTGTADGSGKFEITLTTALLNNTKATVISYDAAKNASPSFEIIGKKDTIQPNKVVLRTVIDDVGEDSSIISANGQTSDSKPTFSGTGEAGATVNVFNNGIWIGSTVVQSNSSWSFTPENPLAVGKQSFSFDQVDAASNTSDRSDSFNFEVIPTASTNGDIPDIQALLIDTSAENDIEDLLSQFDQGVISPSALTQNPRAEFSMMAPTLNPLEDVLVDVYTIG